MAEFPSPLRGGVRGGGRLGNGQRKSTRSTQEPHDSRAPALVEVERLKPVGFKFRQQVPVDHFIVDFACLSEGLIIEVDGGTHSTDEETAGDARRERYLREQGFRIVRVWNSEVRENIEGVMDMIVGALGPPPPSPPRKGEGSNVQAARVSYDDADLTRAHRIAAAVLDPEIPVLTLEDLGVLRGVERSEGRVVVKLTPTYTGCPATLAIQLAVEAALGEAGLADARVETVLSPPWSTDQISEEGRRKLKEYGIAPPNRAGGPRALFGEETVACPKCGSTATAKISEFGSTACKALWRCEICAEPFDYFKCI
jgi:ring-1,2-phenylacetyl-CoA epoxidase subunit PaaD